MPNVKQQHYLPQFYLKNFGTNKKLDVYDITKKELRCNQSVEKNARINYFYDIDYNELTPFLSELFEIHPSAKGKEIFKDDQFIEKYLSRIEGAIAPILDDLIVDPNNIAKDDYWDLIIVFLHSLAYRTKWYRESNNNINKQIYDHFIQMFPAQNLSQFNEQASQEQQYQHLLSIKSLLSTSLMLSYNYDWYIGINRSSNINFIISDNPATDLIFGFNDICIPFSPNHAFVFKIKDKSADVLTSDKATGNIIEFSEKSVLLYNVKQFGQALNYVYGDENSINMVVKTIQMVNSKKAES